MVEPTESKEHVRNRVLVRPTLWVPLVGLDQWAAMAEVTGRVRPVAPDCSDPKLASDAVGYSPAIPEPVEFSGRRMRVRMWAAAICASAMAGANGCGLASRSKTDEFQRVAQNLRAENNRLRDVALDLRSRNQDLNQRAVVDAKRITAQQEAVEQLEESVHGYQAEREKMAAAYDALERQVRLAVNAVPETSARGQALDAFVKTHPGWTFDASKRTVIASTDRLFETGRDLLTDDAETALKALAKQLADTGAHAPPIEIAVFSDPPSLVQKAGYEPGAAEDSPKGADSPDSAGAKARFLAAARAARLRERLISAAGLEPARVRLVSASTEPDSDSEPVSELPPPKDDPGEVPDRRIEIRLPREFFEPDSKEATKEKAVEREEGAGDRG
jgi:outer membrane protein OmpA-like peptidoglycan-associated protein